MSSNKHSLNHNLFKLEQDKRDLIKKLKDDHAAEIKELQNEIKRL